jgi:RNA polymerase sigma factor (sigma-70 family)
LARALHHAECYVAADQAREIAHDVASEMAQLPAGNATPALIYVAVTSRLRDHWKMSKRRAIAEGKYQQMQCGVTPAWAIPDAGVEYDELHRRITRVLEDMPNAMRKVFLLVRDEELSYKQVAEQLGIGTGTVHTQLSRANALLRECVARYYADLNIDAAGQEKGKQ